MVGGSPVAWPTCVSSLIRPGSTCLGRCASNVIEGRVSDLHIPFALLWGDMRRHYDGIDRVCLVERWGGRSGAGIGSYINDAPYVRRRCMTKLCRKLLSRKSRLPTFLNSMRSSRQLTAGASAVRAATRRMARRRRMVGTAAAPTLTSCDAACEQSYHSLRRPTRGCLIVLPV